MLETVAKLHRMKLRVGMCVVYVFAWRVMWAVAR